MSMPTVHPGKVLLWELLERDWTLSGLAMDLQMDREVLRDFLEGTEAYAPDLAQKIGKLTDTCVDFWMNLQQNYDASQ